MEGLEEDFLLEDVGIGGDGLEDEGLAGGMGEGEDIEDVVFHFFLLHELDEMEVVFALEGGVGNEPEEERDQ